MVRVRESRKSRLLDDLSAQPHVCNPDDGRITGCREPNGEPTQADADRRRATTNDS